MASSSYRLVYGLPGETCTAKFEVPVRLRHGSTIEIGVLGEQFVGGQRAARRDRGPVLAERGARGRRPDARDRED